MLRKRIQHSKRYAHKYGNKGSNRIKAVNKTVSPSLERITREVQPGRVTMKEVGRGELHLIDTITNGTVHSWSYAGGIDYNSNLSTNHLRLFVESGQQMEIRDERSNTIWQINLSDFFNEHPNTSEMCDPELEDSIMNEDTGWLTHCLWRHHDAWLLENENILIHGTHYISHDHAVELGRNPNEAGLQGTDYFTPGFIMEIQPSGENWANIAWEWYMTDHFVQDYDPAMQNYVEDISQRPDKIDINLPGENGIYDWTDFSHLNTVHYNPDLDQVAISSRSMGDGEFYIIQRPDGEIVWRCCNPKNYGYGDEEDQLTRHQHGANWIPPGYPSEGNLILFNNSHIASFCIDLGIDECNTCYNCVWNDSYCEFVDGPWGNMCEIASVLNIDPLRYNWNEYNYEVMNEIDGESIVYLAGGGAFMMPNGNVFIRDYGGYMEVSTPFGENPSKVWDSDEITGSPGWLAGEFRGVKYILGCTDKASSNYDPAAAYMYMIDDGSCTGGYVGPQDPIGIEGAGTQ